MLTKMLRVLNSKLNRVVRAVIYNHTSSFAVSLFIQYSLLVSLLVLPSPSKADGLQQDPPQRTSIPPVRGIGSAGTGPGGSFNVDPPSQRQGPPPGVRDTAQVLNEARTPPRIPDPIPSTESYCWPGDPACRKPPRAKPQTPAPKPTPAPRPRRASVLRPELMVASNGQYVEKLLSSTMPYLSHLWNSEKLLHPENRNYVPSAKEQLAFLALRSSAESVSASYIWADCSDVQGYADGAQATVYIYVDGNSVGTASVQGGNYFSFNISAYVNDGGYHDVSAWYYNFEWQWLVSMLHSLIVASSVSYGWRKCTKARARSYRSSTIIMIGTTQTRGTDKHRRLDTIQQTMDRVLSGAEPM